MIICLCKAVNERRLRDAVRSAEEPVVEVQRRCGAGTVCGACRDDVVRIVRDEQVRGEQLAAK